MGSTAPPLFVVDESGLSRNERLIASFHGAVVLLDALRADDVASQDVVVFDVDLTRPEQTKQLRLILKEAAGEQVRIFAANHMHRVEIMYANILGAKHILRRPLQESRLRHLLYGDLAMWREALAETRDTVETSIASTATALQDMF